MIKLLLLITLLLKKIFADGEDFIKRVEEIIENENNTLEQKQKLVELETVFAYGEKFRFQDKMVDLNQYYSRESKENEVVESVKVAEENTFVEVNEEKVEESENATILMMSHVMTYIDTMKYTLQHTSPVKYPPVTTLVVGGLVVCIAGVCGGVGLWYCTRRQGGNTGSTESELDKVSFSSRSLYTFDFFLELRILENKLRLKLKLCQAQV